MEHYKKIFLLNLFLFVIGFIVCAGVLLAPMVFRIMIFVYFLFCLWLCLYYVSNNEFPKFPKSFSDKLESFVPTSRHKDFFIDTIDLIVLVLSITSTAIITTLIAFYLFGSGLK